MKKVKIHPIFFFLAFSSVITGLFKDFLIFTSIIFFHELGHIILSIKLKWNISSINFYPFGGLIKFNEKINKPLIEELLITISGLVFQILYFLIIIIIYNTYLISNNTYIIFKNYHYSILLFNLIPIYPLDGIRIINLLLCKNLPFKLSHLISIIISYIFLVVFIMFYFKNYLSANIILITLLLINKTFEELKYHNYYFNKFIFERYLYNIKFNKLKTFDNDNIYKMYRDRVHIFKFKNKYITEKKFFKIKFNKI